MEKTLIDQFIDMENKLQLYEKKYNGFSYWYYLRKNLYSEIAENVHKTGKAFTETTISLKKIPYIIKQLLFNKKCSLKSFKGSYDYLFFCHPRRVLVDGKYQSIYSDIYANTLGKTLTIERPFGLGHETPCETKNMMYMDKMFYVRALKLKIFGTQNKKLRNEIEDDVRKISGEIEKRFAYQVDEKVLIKRIEYFYSRYCYTKNYFKKLLKIIEPKIIVEVVHYNFENMVITEVAREKNIPVVELQHGLIGRHHIAYNYGNINNVNTLPNYLLTFSSFWRDSLRIPRDITEVRETGFAYFENALMKYPLKSIRNKILFLSSGTVGEQLHKVAIDLSQKISDAGYKYKVVYKLHSGEFKDWKQRYPQLLDANIEVIDTPDINLYMLFSESIAQVGVYSTALFEGFGYNLQTYILSHDEAEHVQMLIESGDAVLVSDAEDIINNIEGIQYNKVDVTKYWEGEAYTKTRTFLEQFVADKKE